MGKLVWVVLVVATAVAPAAAQQVEYIDPAGGFTQVVTVADRGVKTIYVSGQVGRGADLKAHVDSAFQGVVRRLEQAGATVNDAVKIRIFVKDFEPDQYGIISEARRATFPEGSWPTSTMVGVQALAREELRVEIEAVAVVAEDGVDLQIDRFGPSNGFSGAVAVTAHGVKTIYVAGQVGRGDGLAAQTASVWERIGQRLATAGASLRDLVTTTTYIADFEPETELAAYRDARGGALALDDMPASTLVGIPTLVNERIKVETDAIAVVGAVGRSIQKEFIDPSRGGFTQVVTTRGTGPKVVHVSGQVGRAGDPLETQADQLYANLRKRLEAAGASLADLLRITIYMPNYTPGDAAVLAAAREKHGFPADKLPASTLLGIQSLYSSEAGIEIEGVAVVGR